MNDEFKVRVGAELDKNAEKQIQDGLNKVTPKPIEVPFKIDFKNSKEIENEMNRIVSKLTNGKGSLADFKINTNTVFDKDLGQRVEKLSSATIKYKNELGEVVSELYKFNQIGSRVDESGQEEAIMGWSKAMSSYGQNVEQATKKQNELIMKQKELTEQMKLLQIQADKSGTTLDQGNVSGFSTASNNNDIISMAHYLKLAKTEYSQLNALMEKDLPITGLENMKKNIGTMPIDIQNVETSFKRLQIQPEELNNRIKQLSNSFQLLNTFKGDDAEKVKQYNLLKGEISGVTKEINSLIKAQQQQILDTDKTKFKSSIVSWSNENTKAGKEFRVELERIQRELSGADKTKFNNLKKEFQSIQTQAKAMNITGRTTLQELGNNMSKFASWYGIAGIVTSGVSGVKKLVSSVIELDKSLVNLQQATGYTADEAGKLLNTYIDLGQELGATGVEVANSADAWLRQGKSISETNTLIKDSMILSKVGQIDSAQATEYLTSAMKGYQVQTSKVLEIVDKLSAVDMSSATNASGLAEAMSKVASMASLAGVSMDKLLSYLATVGEVTQKDMSSIGESFQTMFSRMGNIKLGVMTDTETGESLNDVEGVLKNLGISLRDSDDSFRDFGDVLDDIGGKWNSLSQVEQNALGVAIAGTRQRENFTVLMSNYGKSLEYAGISAESSGTAMEKFSNYEQSVEAKTKTLQASLQELATDTLDSDLVKGFLDVSNVLVNTTNDIGLLNIATVGLLSLLGSKTGVFKLLTDQISLAMVAQTGYTASTTSAAIAQVGLTGAITATGQALKLFLFTNPVGWVLTLGTAILGATKLYDLFNVSLEENQETLANLKGEYDSLASEVDSLNEQLETTQSRIDELNAKDSPSFIEQEELAKLNETNKSLERQLKIKQELANTKAVEVEEQAIKTLNTKSEVSTPTQAETLQMVQSGQYSVPTEMVTRDVALQEQMALYDELIAKQKELDAAYDDGEIALENYISQTETNSQSLNDAKKKAAELALSLDEESQSITGVTKDGKTYKENIDDILKAYDEFIDKTNEVINATSGINDSTDNIKNDSVTALNNAMTELENTITALPTKLGELEEVQEKVNDGYSFSYDEIQKLKSTYPELESAIYRTADGWGIEKDAVDTLYSSVGDLSTQFQSAEALMTDFLSSETAKRLEMYGLEIKTLSDLANLKAGAEMRQQTELGIGHQSLETMNPSLYAEVQSYQDALSRIEELKAQAKDITSGKVSGSGSKSSSSKSSSSSSNDDPHLDAFNSKKSDLQHQLEMDEITEKQYYDKLEKLEDTYLTNSKANRKKYKTEIQQTDEEIYKGRKQLEDESIKSQFDNLEYNYNKGLLTEAEYQKKRWELAKQYYWKNSDYADEWQDEVVSHNEYVAQKTIDNIEAIAEASKNSLDDAVDSISDYSDGSDAKFNAINKAITTAENAIANYNDAISILNRNKGKMSAEEYTEELANLNDGLQDAKDSAEDLNKTLLEFPAEQLEKVNEDLQDYLDILNDKKDTYDSVISAVTSALDDQVESLETAKNGIESYYDSLITSKQDELDTLQETNDEQQKAIDLQKAQYNLQKAQNQKTNRIFKDGKFVYEANTESIQDAQSEVDNLLYEAMIDDKQKELDALEEQKESALNALDTQIDRLNDIKDSWSEIGNIFTNLTNSNLANGLLGDNWLNKIMSGDTSVITNFQSLYTSAESSINAVEDEIDANTQRIESIQNWVQAYTDGTTSIETAKGQIDAIVSNNTTELQANEARKNSATSVSDQWKTTQQSITGTDGTKSTLGTDGSLGIIQSAQELARDEELQVLNERIENLQNYATEVQNISTTVARALSSILSNLEQARSASAEMANLNGRSGDGNGNLPVSVGETMHSGLELGYVGDSSSTSLKDAFKYIALEKVEPDEFITKLQADEAVLNPLQQSNILSNYNNAFLAGVNYSFPDIVSQNKTVQPSFSIGEIIVQGVDNPSGLAKEIKTNLLPILNQQLGK